MSDKVRVGLIGLGAIGRVHHSCYQNSKQAELVAVCDVDPKKLGGLSGDIKLNLDAGPRGDLAMGDLATYESYTELLKDDSIHMVDICLPTRLHANVTIDALNAGKHVLVEKPMSWDAAECDLMAEAALKNDRQIVIGHCLRYWPQYVEANKIIESGEYGEWKYAKFMRYGGPPRWSWNNWLLTGDQSGGVILDMHVHDVDTALWWFGDPQSITAAGTVIDNTPMSLDAIWKYDGGKVASLYGAWDRNGGNFTYGFQVELERASISYYSWYDGPNLKLMQNDQQTEIVVPDALAYQLEIDDFVDCVATGRKIDRITPATSKHSVEVVREELAQVLPAL